MPATPIVPRVRAALRLEKIKILLLLAGAKVIYNGMSANVARFPSPIPTMVILNGQITTLDAAQQIVVSGVRGPTTAARNTARDALWVTLVTLKAYVQSIADATESNAVEIIKSAGYDVATPRPAHDKPVLAVALTITSGEVKLTGNARALTGGSKRRVTYIWQYSLDGGHTWVSVPTTTTAETTIAGLPLMTNCSFRVSVSLANVQQPWSQVVSIPVT